MLVLGLLHAVLVPIAAGGATAGAVAAPTAEVAASRFTDGGGTFADEIEWLATAGITLGCNPPANDRFCPERAVTRGQMAAFLTRALGLTDTGTARFVDTRGHTFEDEVRKLATAGITLGCNPPANDRFCPERAVTRGQMAAFLTRALGLTDTGTARFVDTRGHTFEDEVRKLATAGITLGCNPPANDRFCPERAVTRGQMAAFLFRSLAIPAASDRATGAPTTKTGVTGTIQGPGGPTGPLPDVPRVPPGAMASVLEEPPPAPPAGAPPVTTSTTSPMPATDPAPGAASTSRFVAQSIIPRSDFTQTWLDYGSLPYAVGQLTFPSANDPTRATACTGTLVSRNIVLTAAHCVLGTSQIYFQPDEFASGWDAKPWWRTDASRAYVPTVVLDAWRADPIRWMTNANQVLDYALVVFPTPNSAGQLPGDRYRPYRMQYMAPNTGPQAAGAFRRADVRQWALGYPMEGWFAGQGNSPVSARPWHCWGDRNLSFEFGNGYYMLVQGCDLNGGMSGGPVLRSVGGEWRIIGVTSSLGRVVPCSEFPTQPCSSASGRYFGQNLWSVPLLQTTGDYGFDDLWRAVTALPEAR